MSSESEDVTFTGTDGLTCHQFIRAVRQHAIKAEKQRDDQWIADEVSIRFDGDALVWYESLDDGTQNDWKLLRRAILAQYTKPASDGSALHDNKVPGFTFMANSQEERRSFVKYIRSKAFAEGKEDDFAWMVKLAYPCFSGKALDWHASLPADIQQDWRRLERSILLNYPAQPTLRSSILDYPPQPTLSIPPARIHIKDWYCQIKASSSLQSIQSQEDWLAQARERRRMYLEANDTSIPCWLLVETESEIPDNAIPTGPAQWREAFCSARAWQGQFGLVVGRCGRNLPGAHLPLNNKEIANIKPFEVLVGDPSNFQWIAVPPKGLDGTTMAHPPFEAVEAGMGASRATFICQGFQNRGWHPGKVHSGDSVSFFSWGGSEVQDNSVRVLAWAI